MYQLFKYGTSSLQKNVPLSLRSLKENRNLTLEEKTCLLYKNLNINYRLQLRTQSSVTNYSLTESKRGKKKRRTKNYTDVFVVTNKFSGLKRANVVKLSPQNLNLLATTNLSLNELYKLKDMVNNHDKPAHTYSNLDIIGSVNDIPKTSDEIPLSKICTREIAEDLEHKRKLQSYYQLNFRRNLEVTSSDSDFAKAPNSNPFHRNIVPTYVAEDIEDKLSSKSNYQLSFKSSFSGSPNRVSANIPLTNEAFTTDFEVEGEGENSESHMIENDLEFKSAAATSTFQPEVVEEVQETVEPNDFPAELPNKLESTKDISEQKHRDAVAEKTLAGLIEMCNHLKNPQRGLAALNFHQSRAKRFKQYFKPIRKAHIYCSLLKGFAHKGDYLKLNKVLEMMMEEDVKPNLQCFIAIFECLGRINVQNHYLKDIRIFVKQALRENITFDQMMSKGVFLNDERDCVLKAFRAFDPDYVPTYEQPKVWYNNELVNSLNDERQKEYRVPKWEENGGLFTPEIMKERVLKQVNMETATYVSVKSIDAGEKPTKETSQKRVTLNEHYKMWAADAEVAFQRDLATLTAQKGPISLEPYMRCIPVKEFIDVIVEEAKRLAQGSESYSPEASLLHKLLGNKVYARYRILTKQKTGVLEKMLNIHSKYCEVYAATHGELSSLPTHEQFVNPRMQWQLVEHSQCDSGSTLSMDHQPWVPSTLSAIGKFLYHIIMHDLKINVNCINTRVKHKNFLPAFYTIFRSQGHLVKEEIKPHPMLVKLYRASQPDTLTFPANEIPMLCPPVPWTSINNGGYVVSHTDVIRLPSQASYQKHRLRKSEPEQLYPSLDALNQLGAVPWKVNTKVLDIILTVFRNGGSDNLDVPQPPSSLPVPHSGTFDMDKTQKYQLFKLKLQYKRKKAEMYSLWCDCLYRLSLANHFRNDIFWLPHNMDFRGRVYPVPPHLNHLGSDLARSMLVFAEGRPLGPEGLDWLKIHLINLTGLKKRDSLKDRLAFANENMDLILDSADNPLNGKMWWSQSDEPWQTLACCIEIADVIRSGINPAEYRSHFPVHQDGSCNGLQHYAALGRDSAGAYSVNLAPSDIPQDVYSTVVALVEDQRAKDEKNGIQIAQVLNGFVKRKVIKQTIMTTVYGVTKYGAKLQIAKQLKDIDNFPKEAVWSASNYLTHSTFESLRTMFTSTREIQDWFTECARLISGAVGKHLEWVTPLGLPIVQPYVKFKKLSTVGYATFSIDQFEKPNMVKQKNAFPPNFIHSLDSSHMMLTSLHCERAGITFVSVHDCYWTHPSTINIMNKICREQFVALHSQPILENLSVFLYDRYGYEDCNLPAGGAVCEQTKKRLNKVLKRLPRTGDFDITNVLNSIYFFS